MEQLQSLSGSSAHYPKLNEATEGEVLVEKGKYVDTSVSEKFGSNAHIFEVTEFQAENSKGETGSYTRIGLSAGQVSKAMEKCNFGDWVKIVYMGKKAIQNGKWKGQEAHTFQIDKYVTDGTQSAPQETAAPAPEQTQAPTNSDDGLDEMFN